MYVLYHEWYGWFWLSCGWLNSTAVSSMIYVPWLQLKVNKWLLPNNAFNEAVLDCFIERLIGHHMTRVTYSSWVGAMACRSCIDERAVEVRLLEPTLAHTTVNQRQHQIMVRSVSLLYNNIMMTSFTGYVLTHSIWACVLNHCYARYHDDVMRWHIVHVLWTRGRRNATYIHTYIHT